MSSELEHVVKMKHESFTFKKDINLLSLFVLFLCCLSLASYDRLLVEKIIHMYNVFYEQMTSQ